MNAAVADIEDSNAPLMRKIHGAERSWLHFRLQQWGEWTEKNSDFEGYPRADAIASWLEGGGGGSGGHRVLCLDPPESVARTHLRLQQLNEDERMTIWVEYVPSAKVDGSTWTRSEKCELLGLSERGYRDRLHRAFLRYLGLVPPRS